MLKFLSKLIDPMIGQTVIRFTTHGCMGEINEFDYIGTIVDSAQGGKFYKVEVFKSKHGEKREKNLLYDFDEVPSWYLQKMGNFYIAYD